MEGASFRSPLRTLLRFLVRSRDGWKRKCRQAKWRIQLLGNRVRKLTVSRDRWKEKAQSLRSELARVEAELQALKTA